MNLRFRLALCGLAAVAMALTAAWMLPHGGQAPLLLAGTLAALGFIAIAELLVVRHVNRIVHCTPETSDHAEAEVPEDTPIPLKNIQLAREYVEGIALLVDVATEYDTPVPAAAAKNLRYLSRLLHEAETALRARPPADPNPQAITSMTYVSEPAQRSV